MTNQANGSVGERRKARIYHVRMAKNLTQSAFATRIGIHFVTLCRLENYRIVPSPELAEAIGKVTGQSPGEVIDEYMQRRAS